MSESPKKVETPSKKDIFTEKEERVLKLAWQCLKSGPPEIDIKKLTKTAGFNTEKTAANTWGVIKKKLNAMAPANDAEDIEGTKSDAGTTTPKKRTKKDVDNDGDGIPSTAKKSRKSPAKKAQAVKVEDTDDLDGSHMNTEEE